VLDEPEKVTIGDERDRFYLPVIADSYAGADPPAVVVKSLHTIIATVAVEAPRWPKNTARQTKLQWKHHG